MKPSYNFFTPDKFWLSGSKNFQLASEFKQGVFQGGVLSPLDMQTNFRTSFISLCAVQRCSWDGLGDESKISQLQQLSFAAAAYRGWGKQIARLGSAGGPEKQREVLVGAVESGRGQKSKKGPERSQEVRLVLGLLAFCIHKGVHSYLGLSLLTCHWLVSLTCLPDLSMHQCKDLNSQFPVDYLGIHYACILRVSESI